MSIDLADLDLDFSLFFAREQIVAAEWDLAFIEELEFGYEVLEEDAPRLRTFCGLSYNVADGRLWSETVCEREQDDGLVVKEHHERGLSDRQLMEELESLDAIASDRIRRQRLALELLESRELWPIYSNTLANMAAEIRSLRDMDEAGSLAAALIADALHEDERVAGLALAGVR